MRKALLSIALMLAVALSAEATPTISSVAGTFGAGQTVALSGSGWGSKSPAAPLVWADFASNVNPSSLGRKTSWDEIQNFTWSANAGYGSTGGAVGTAGIGTWTFRADSTSPNFSDFGQTSYIFRRTKQNFIVTTDGLQNWKIWRLWDLSGNGRPNIYVASSNGRAFVEYMPVESGFWSNFNANSTNWVAEEILTKASSAADVKDGTLLYRVDGQDKASGTLLTYSASNPFRMYANYVVHGVGANIGGWSPAWSASNQMWTDEVYVDTTYQRVMIGDAPTFAACRKFGLIVITAWSPNNISGVVSCTAFSNGETAYLYVFDANNTPNASGFPVTINGTVAGNPAPTLTRINISTASYLGGDVRRLTGTNFLNSPAPTVQVAGVNAPSVTFNSSTSVDFTVPAGTQGLLADVALFNNDGQFAVITSTLQYSVAALVDPTRDTPIMSQRKILMEMR